MEQEWIEIRLPVPAHGADLVAAALNEIGCTGLITEERRLDTFIPPDPDEVPAEGYTLRAFFPGSLQPNRLRLQILTCLQELAPLVPGLQTEALELLSIATEDWAEGWKQHFGLTRLGRRLVIHPTWETYTPAADEAVVVLDPGMAFGTGTHGTTRLCLEALAELFDGPPPPRVLDVGTGSGILAIAAAALGAQRVLACDIDEQACRTARENAAANAVDDRVEITERPLETLEGGFQVVLANILAEELVRLGPELDRRLEAGGTLVLSGILQEKEGLVIDGFIPLGLRGPEIRRQEEWSCLLYRKP